MGGTPVDYKSNFSLHVSLHKSKLVFNMTVLPCCYQPRYSSYLNVVKVHCNLSYVTV